MVWLASLLKCDVCAFNRIEHDGTRQQLITKARAKGWKILDTTTLGGKDFTSHVCPDCSRVVRPPKVERLEGEVELF